jgi:hypothetical protein
LLQVLKVLKVLLDHKVLLEQQERLAQLAQQVLQERQVQLVPLVLKGRLVQLVHKDLQVLKVLLVQLAHREFKANKVQWDLKGLQVKQEQLEPLVLQEQLDLKVCKEKLDLKGQWVLKVRKAFKENKGLKVFKD